MGDDEHPVEPHVDLAADQVDAQAVPDRVGGADQVVHGCAGGAVERRIGGGLGIEGGGKGGAGREKGEPGHLPGPAEEKFDGATRKNRAGAHKKLGSSHPTVLGQERLDTVNDPAAGLPGRETGRFDSRTLRCALKN